MVFDKNPAEFRGTVDQSPKVHADQLEVGRGLGSCTEFLVGNLLAVRWFLAAVTRPRYSFKCVGLESFQNNSLFKCDVLFRT